MPNTRSLWRTKGFPQRNTSVLERTFTKLSKVFFQKNEVVVTQQEYSEEMNRQTGDGEPKNLFFMKNFKSLKNALMSDVAFSTIFKIGILVIPGLFFLFWGTGTAFTIGTLSSIGATLLLVIFLEASVERPGIWTAIAVALATWVLILDGIVLSMLELCLLIGGAIVYFVVLLLSRGRNPNFFRIKRNHELHKWQYTVSEEHAQLFYEPGNATNKQNTFMIATLLSSQSDEHIREGKRLMKEGLPTVDQRKIRRGYNPLMREIFSTVEENCDENGKKIFNGKLAHPYAVRE